MARPYRRPSTPNDLEMTDTAMSPVPSPRQPLPTSLASFALSHSTSAPTSPASTSIMSIDRDDLTWPALLAGASFPAIRKLRRSSLLSSRPTDRADHASSSGSGSGSRSARSGSPINTVFLNWDDDDTKEHSQSPIVQSPADSDGPTASSSSTTDTALRLDTNLISRETTQIPRQMTLDDYGLSPIDKSVDPPSTPRPTPHPGSAFVPSPPSSKPIDVPKLSMHLKPARLIAVLQENNVQEAEMQSEASFQRLVASHAELPLAFHPRTPRSARGRFPEEFSAEDEDNRNKDGDDDSDDDDVVVVLGAPSGESGAAEASAWANDTPTMDVEMASSSGSPSVTSSAMQSVISTPQPVSASPQTLSLSWRDKGPLAAMSGRAPKRKHASEERFDPYAHPTKRRAVSPAVTIPTSGANNGISHPLLHSLSSSPVSTISRSPITVTMSPYSYSGSLTPGGNGSRSLHASPILRAVHRLPTAVREKEEKERAKAVNGARDGVRSINLSGS